MAWLPGREAGVGHVTARRARPWLGRPGKSAEVTVQSPVGSGRRGASAARSRQQALRIRRGSPLSARTASEMLVWPLAPSSGRGVADTRGDENFYSLSAIVMPEQPWELLEKSRPQPKAGAMRVCDSVTGKNSRVYVGSISVKEEGYSVMLQDNFHVSPSYCWQKCQDYKIFCFLNGHLRLI
ncbi:uncharacterized protein LOC143648028 [Tamandua tetradactyla]|uniref:uncharacterized protein LOC143648028 n=1 Tax=Tamandua tetradactyla TaxID=48850 RepID=UPI004053BBA8